LKSLGRWRLQESLGSVTTGDPEEPEEESRANKQRKTKEYQSVGQQFPVRSLTGLESTT
jgi:hypothetical protein